MPVEDQGAGLNRYRIIPRVLIFIFNQNAVLLIKGAPHKRLWANRYNGIGGHVERGEDVLSAAQRELFEESGLTVSNLHLCGTVMIDAGSDGGIGLFVYKGQTNTRNVFHSEEGSLEWIPVSDLNQYPLVDDLPVLLPRVIQWKTGDPEFSARYYYDEDQHLHMIFASCGDSDDANS